MEVSIVLWVLCATALMLGTLYAIVVPSRVDSMMGLNLKTAKGISAMGTGIFLALLVCKVSGLPIPGIELGAAIFIFAAAAPSTLSLIVAVAPEKVVEFFTGKRGV